MRGKFIFVAINAIGGYVLHFPFRFVEDWVMGWLQGELSQHWGIFITWVLPFAVAFGLVYAGYSLRKAKTKTDTQSPIKSVVLSAFDPRLSLSQFVRNVKDDHFRITAYVDIDIENNTDHVIKIASTNLLLEFGDKCLAQSPFFRKMDTVGNMSPIQKYPIEIQPYTTRQENMYMLEYFDVVRIKRKFLNKSPKNSWVYFELVGANISEEYRPIDMSIDVRWQD